MSNELHTMPLKVEKLLSSQRFRRMRWDEKGAYMLLLAEAWLDGARLENNPDGIRELLGVSDDSDWSRIKKFVLDRMFVPSEDGNWLVNSTQAEIFQETITKHKALSEGGKRGNEKRWGSNRHPIAGQSPPDRIRGDRIQSQSQSQSQRESYRSPEEPEEGEQPMSSANSGKSKSRESRKDGEHAENKLLRVWIASGKPKAEYERRTKAKLPEISYDDQDCLERAGVVLEKSQLSHVRRGKALIGEGKFSTLCHEVKNLSVEGHEPRKNETARFLSFLEAAVRDVKI